MVASALVFDLDGTVWDSAPWYAAGIAAAVPAVDHAQLHRDFIAGLNIVRALASFGLTKAALLKSAVKTAGPPPLFLGMSEALDSLKRQGMPMGVATSLPGSIALPMMSACGIDQYFRTVVHAGNCRVPKPNPASLLMAVDGLGMKANKSIFYIGDRASDSEASVRAGLSMAWMSHGYGVGDAADTDRILNPRELLGL